MMLCNVAGPAPARGGALSEPAPIPVATAARDDLKTYLRLTGNDEDGLLDRLIATAIGHGEGLTGRLFLTREVTETIAAWPAWRRLARTPVRTIQPPALLGLDGTATALPVDSYGIDIDGSGDGWLIVRTPGDAARIRLTYRAGIAADWVGLPDPLRQGVIRLAAHLYTHRDGADEAAPPAAVAALWRPWRRMRLA